MDSGPNSEWYSSLAPLLREAGALALRLRDAPDVRVKPDGSLVTAADEACEALLNSAIAQRFPDYACVGEEGTNRVGSEGTIFMDPLDGTQAYVEGFAHWGPTVAVVREGVVVAGGFYQVAFDELFWAELGGGAWRNQVRLEPAEPGPETSRRQVLLVPSRFHRVGPLDWPGKVRALGSTAAHLALVAAGGAAATMIPAGAAWDVAAGVLLVREAGREVCTLEGAPLTLIDGRAALPFLAGAPTPIRRLVRAWADREAKPLPETGLRTHGA